MKQDSSTISGTKESLSKGVWATFRKYKIIFLGYAVSLGLFIATSIVDISSQTSLLGETGAFLVDRMIFGTMIFCGFLIVYLVNEQKLAQLR